jgi:hypothetical protein
MFSPQKWVEVQAEVLEAFLRIAAEVRPGSAVAVVAAAASVLAAGRPFSTGTVRPSPLASAGAPPPSPSGRRPRPGVDWVNQLRT